MTQWADKKPWNLDDLKGYSGPIRIWWGEHVREYNATDNHQHIFNSLKPTHYERNLI